MRPPRSVVLNHYEQHSWITDLLVPLFSFTCHFRIHVVKIMKPFILTCLEIFVFLAQKGLVDWPYKNRAPKLRRRAYNFFPFCSLFRKFKVLLSYFRYYNSLPPISKAFGTLCFFTTVLVQIQILPPGLLFLSYPHVFKNFEVSICLCFLSLFCWLHHMHTVSVARFCSNGMEYCSSVFLLKVWSVY